MKLKRKLKNFHISKSNILALCRLDRTKPRSENIRKNAERQRPSTYANVSCIIKYWYNYVSAHYNRQNIVDFYD